MGDGRVPGAFVDGDFVFAAHSNPVGETATQHSSLMSRKAPPCDPHVRECYVVALPSKLPEGIVSGNSASSMRWGRRVEGVGYAVLLSTGISSWLKMAIRIQK